MINEDGGTQPGTILINMKTLLLTAFLSLHFAGIKSTKFKENGN